MERTWRIGEVAERTGLTRRTLRHYDDLGLLRPSARSWGDYRLYDANDLLRLLQIQNLKALGLSLAEIATALDDPSLDARATLHSHLEVLAERIAAEQQLAARLSALADDAERSWDDVLEAIALTHLQTHTNPVTRIRAALLPSGRSTDELFAALLSEDDLGVQEVLVWALAQRSQITERALAALPTAAAGLRASLARLLGKAHDPQAAPALIALLADPDSEVRRAAAYALGSLGAAAAVAPVAALLGGGEIPDAVLIDALAAIGAEAIEPTAAVVIHGGEAAQVAAIEALGRLAGVGGDPAAICAALDAALQHGTLTVRRSALMELSGLGDPGRELIAGMRDDPELGSLAVRLHQQLGSTG